jgi:hypothetical protein
MCYHLSIATALKKFTPSRLFVRIHCSTSGTEMGCGGDREIGRGSRPAVWKDSLSKCQSCS